MSTDSFISSDTQRRFHKNLEQVATNLVSAFNLEFKQEVPQLGNALFRWLDFRLRYVDSVPRKVLTSNKFPKPLPATVEAALHHLEKLMREGRDVNLYQSKGLIQFNDVSGKKPAKRTDLLWADWGIIHFHLTDLPLVENEYFSKRDCSDKESWLLFCIVVADSIGLVDIRPHSDECIFSDIEMLSVIKANWPEHMEKSRVKGIITTAQTYTNKDIELLRKNGITTFVTIDGQAYMPGGGITSASTSMQVTMRANELQHWIKELAVLADDEGGQFRTEIRKLGVENPFFELCLTPQGLAIFESTANIAFSFARNRADESPAYSAAMLDLISPNWALEKLALASLAT